MNIVRRFVLLGALCLLVASATALMPDDVVISTDHRWLTAGGTETSLITVQVINTTLPTDPVEDAVVVVWCDDDQMGKITPASSQRIKKSSPFVTYTFTPGTKSGNATLYVSVTHPERTEAIGNSTIQRIDHAIPYEFASLSYNASAPVGSVVLIQVRFKDRYGNLINSLREDDESRTAEVITFRDSEDGDGWFLDGSDFVNVLNRSVNSVGNVTVQYQLASVAGANIISIKPPSSVIPSQTFITIEGVGVLSATITAVMDPSTGVVYANSQDTVLILYTVQDVDKNPIRNATIIRTSSIGETTTFRTNDQGQVITSYGPKASIGTVTLIATVQGYPNVMVVNTVEFIHTDPVMWELTASPQTLASRDVKEDITADIKAKVMDILGNPVENETVTFSIVGVTNTTRLNQTPELVNTTATTDLDGFAIVQFRPGAFPIWGETGYNQTATGTATVRASWDGKTKDLLITFKNYPYLRVETSVAPQTVQVNQSVDVTIRLIGDGWALRPKPIDVLLVTDRSGSMLLDEPEDRMIPVKNASKEFAQQMDLSQSQDHIGLVSFGVSGTAKIAPTWSGWSWNWNSIYGGQTGSSPLRNDPGWWWVSRDNYYDSTPSSYSSSSAHHQYVVQYYNSGNPRSYSDYAVVDVALNWSPSTINNSIQSMVPSGGTPLRYAVYRAINEMNSSGRSSAVRAIIVLSDGDYNWYGDPLARGTGYSTCDPTSYGDLTQNYCRLSGLNASTYNLSNYAISKNVRIYSIGYAADISTGGRNTLRTLSESTGGKYYDGDAANIADIYRSIAGDLKTVAGVNTQMNLSFQSVNVTFNNITNSLYGSQVFKYQWINGISTYITSWNTTVNPLPGHTPAYPYTYNQLSQWTSDPPHLYFDVGNISINQTWQATFRFTIKQPGSINIFGAGSGVSFNGSEGMYTTSIPDTFITAIANMTQQTANQTLVDVWITGTSDPTPGSVTEFLDVDWVLNYTGNYTVQQDLYYQFSSDNVVWPGSWTLAGTMLTGTGPIPDEPFSGSIDVRGKSGWMKILVKAKEQLIGGAYDDDYWPNPIPIGPGSQVYIKIT